MLPSVITTFPQYFDFPQHLCQAYASGHSTLKNAAALARLLCRSGVLPIEHCASCGRTSEQSLQLFCRERHLHLEREGVPDTRTVCGTRPDQWPTGLWRRLSGHCSTVSRSWGRDRKTEYTVRRKCAAQVSLNRNNTHLMVSDRRWCYSACTSLGAGYIIRWLHDNETSRFRRLHPQEIENKWIREVSRTATDKATRWLNWR